MSLFDIDPCALYQLPVPVLLAALMNNDGGLGQVKMMEVEPTEESYFGCNARPVSVPELIRLVTGFDDCDEPAIRFGRHTGACGNPFSTCVNNNTTLQSVFMAMIGKTATGEAYIRMNIQDLP